MPNRTDYSFSYPYQNKSWKGTPLWQGPDFQMMAGWETGVRVASGERRPKPRGGWIPPTSYSMTETYRKNPVGSVQQFHDDPRYWWAGDNQVGAIVTAGTVNEQLVVNTMGAPADLANRSLSKARSALKDQKVNLGQAWAERRQVSNQVLQTAKKLATAAVALRKGHWKDACSALGIKGVKPVSKTLASQWLGYQYGWKPLLSDIHGAVLALEKRDRDQWMVTVKGSASSVQQQTSAYRANLPYANDGSGKSVFGVMTRIDACPSNSAVASAASLGLTNPVLLAWELVPFSFVVDWFVPIGDYLSQFDALAGWEIRGYSQSTLSKMEWSFRGYNGRWNSTVGMLSHYGLWYSHYRSVSLNRSAGTSVPFPMFPNIKDPISKAHLANAAALLRVAFR